MRNTTRNTQLKRKAYSILLQQSIKADQDALERLFVKLQTDVEQLDVFSTKFREMIDQFEKAWDEAKAYTQKTMQDITKDVQALEDFDIGDSDEMRRQINAQINYALDVQDGMGNVFRAYDSVLAGLRVDEREMKDAIDEIIGSAD
jgi:cell division septum initiation protein DivIVA